MAKAKKKKGSQEASKLGRPPKAPMTLEDRKQKYKANISNYDYADTTDFIDEDKPLSLKDLGFTLPEQPPTQVVSLRIPTELLNEIKALSSQNDIPYQSLIKLFLSESIQRKKKKLA